MTRVKKSELRMGRDHKHPTGPVLILHGDRVVKRGHYTEIAQLFDEITEDNPESTVAVEYEK